jgi:hypothetical protein
MAITHNNKIKKTGGKTQMIEEEKKVSPAEWTEKSYLTVRGVIRKHCPQGLNYCCDGTPLERGLPYKGKCRYYRYGRCFETYIVNARKCADRTARRKASE